MQPAWSLCDVQRIGLIGDLNGDTHAAIRISRQMKKRGVTCLVQVGNFGFLNSRLELANLRWLSEVLEGSDQTIVFVDGNHENFDELIQFPVQRDGVRWVTPQIGHLPRGFRARVGANRTLAALGGANSVDAWRGYWEGESITDRDLERLGPDQADILIGHDAPLSVPSLDRFLYATKYRWPSSGREYAESGRRMFHRGFLAVRPRLYIGGHHHYFIDERVTYASNNQAFESRIVLLEDSSSFNSKNLAILDTDSFDIEFLTDTEETPTQGRS